MTNAFYLGYTLGYVMIGMLVCNLRFWYSIFLIMVYGSSIIVYIWKSQVYEDRREILGHYIYSLGCLMIFVPIILWNNERQSRNFFK